jgi:hypothetical protein
MQGLAAVDTAASQDDEDDMTMMMTVESSGASFTRFMVDHSQDGYVVGYFSAGRSAYGIRDKI